VSLCVSFCLVGEVISHSILLVLGIMAHITVTKLKRIEMLLFHSSALALHYVPQHDMLYVTPFASLQPDRQIFTG